MQDHDSLQQYFTAISTYPRLSREDESSLAQGIEKGCEDSRRRLTESNLRLVVSVAKRFQGHGVPLEDLIQEGNIGLMKAVEKFDWRRDVRFSTHAMWWIRLAVTRAVANTSRTIRVPVNVHDFLVKINKVTKDLENKLGREPSEAEVADILKVPVTKLRDSLFYDLPMRSLSEPFGPEEDDNELHEIVYDRTEATPEEIALDL